MHEVACSLMTYTTVSSLQTAATSWVSTTTVDYKVRWGLRLIHELTPVLGLYGLNCRSTCCTTVGILVCRKVHPGDQ